MTESGGPVKSVPRRRTGGPTAATRITTAGLAVAVTLGLGSAVTARAAEQKRADARKLTAQTEGSGAQADLDAATESIRAEERARYDKKAKQLRDKYQKSLNKLAAEYSAKLGAGSSSSSGSSSGSSSSGGSYSGSSGGGGSTYSSGGSSSSSNNGNGGSSSGSSGGSVSPPKAPSTSKGS